MSLCSYHCYNACDAAGAESKTIARDMTKAGEEVLTSHDFTLALRESNYENSWAYTFDKINRNQDFWGSDVLCPPPGINLRAQCEILYQSPLGPNGPHEEDCVCCLPGVIYCRPVPGEVLIKCVI
jgi:hypothetical protein